MLKTHQVEELICIVSSLDRDSLMEQFGTYPSTFPIDFTAQFLDALPLERLRHIFLAICLQSQRLPEVPADAA